MRLYKLHFKMRLTLVKMANQQGKTNHIKFLQTQVTWVEVLDLRWTILTRAVGTEVAIQALTGRFTSWTKGGQQHNSFPYNSEKCQLRRQCLPLQTIYVWNIGNKLPLIKARFSRWCGRYCKLWHEWATVCVQSWLVV